MLQREREREEEGCLSAYPIPSAVAVLFVVFSGQVMIEFEAALCLHYVCECVCVSPDL